MTDRALARRALSAYRAREPQRRSAQASASSSSLARVAEPAARGRLRRPRVGWRTFVRVWRRGLRRRRIVNHHRAALAGGEPNIENRMLDAVQARRVGEHPARENALGLLLLVDFVDLGEGVGLRRIGRRAGIADARRDLQRAELHRLVDRHFERDDAAGDLVEAVEDGDGIADLVGERRMGRDER